MSKAKNSVPDVDLTSPPMDGGEWRTPAEPHNDITGGTSGREFDAPAATEKTTRRGLSPELQAMAKIDRLMAELNASDKGIVTAWFFARFASNGTWTVRKDSADA